MFLVIFSDRVTATVSRSPEIPGCVCVYSSNTFCNPAALDATHLRYLRELKLWDEMLQLIHCKEALAAKHDVELRPDAQYFRAVAMYERQGLHSEEDRAKVCWMCIAQLVRYVLLNCVLGFLQLTAKYCVTYVPVRLLDDSNVLLQL